MNKETKNGLLGFFIGMVIIATLATLNLTGNLEDHLTRTGIKVTGIYCLYAIVQVIKS